MPSHHQAAENNILEITRVAAALNGQTMTADQATARNTSQLVIATTAVAQALLAINESLAAIQQANRPTGSCAARLPGIPPTDSTPEWCCIHNHNHTGAHRLTNGRTW